MTFSDALKIEMAAHRMTVKELAKRLRVSTVCVQQWRNGRWLPKLPQAFALARLFGCQIDYLFPDL